MPDRMGLSRRSRTFVILVAHVALLAYFFQVGAFDHWHSDPSHVVGVANSNAHVMHCHGGGGGCADGATVSPVVDAEALIPLPPAAFREATDPSVSVPGAVFLGSPDQPPRAA
jgi:hypothetical protein